jgi:hypothetical protein
MLDHNVINLENPIANADSLAVRRRAACLFVANNNTL